MEVREVMTPNPRTVGPDDTIQRAASVMKEIDTGFVPVVENGRVVAVVTDRDIVLRAVASAAYDRTVREIATPDPICVSPDASTRETEKLMSEHKVRRIAVVEDGRLIGVVSLGDLAVKEGAERRAGATLENISEGVKH
jgi:CBS domain-containing protein